MNDIIEYIPLFSIFLISIIISPKDTKDCSKKHVINTIITLCCILLFYSLICSGINEYLSVALSSFIWIFAIFCKRKVIGIKY